MAADVPDEVVERLVERQLEHRLRFRYAAEQDARDAARELVGSLLPDSRVELLDGGGYLWLGPDGERTPVYDVRCAVEEVPRVRDLATELAGAPLTASVFPGDHVAEAFVDDGTFRPFAANMRLAVTDPVPGEELAGRVTVAPMTEDEFETFQVRVTEEYAAEREAAGESREEARRQAEESGRELWAQGLDTPDQFFLTASAEGRHCGVLWLCTRWPTQGYVYDVEIDADLRGRGLGAALMVHAALWARERGLPWLGLNVFGHNAGARALYERLGYEVEEEHLAREL